ncbi:precorrin-8X methylmutase [Gammaproteobacteria bacterium 45_16_T64]|nr:precorrin-8X methylmutase [Gammaproteobacteria bacterium 45_16_T64]
MTTSSDTTSEFTEASRENYIRDPHKIEQESFQRIRQLSDLSAFDQDQAQIAMRLIHTCGEPSISSRINISHSAIKSGIAAINANAPVLCDVEMVKHGLTKRMIEQEVHCFLNDSRVPDIAKAEGETRTMAALRFWEPLVEGSIVLIGNAPTALFRLMEMIENGSPKPALIIGIPVGFVGAAESKDALITFCQQHDIACITVTGYVGGSAMTAAAFNALLRLNKGIRF